MLKNKTVMITGASSGIGAASAKQFAKAGANLLLCARRVDVVENLAQQLSQEFDVNIHTFQLDVTDRDAVTYQLNHLPKLWQDIDILINNAGLAAGLDLFQEGRVDDWETMIDTNVKGLLFVTRTLLPNMVSRNIGHIINISSLAGHDVYPKGAVYCATKSAVNFISKGLRMDLFGTQIRVSTVDPGMVETNFSQIRFKGDVNRAAAVYEGLQPLQADDIADAVLYCASRPQHVNICEVILTPTAQASVTMVAKQ